jgi:DNA-binding GntR family transcriptional regulator
LRATARAFTVENAVVNIFDDIPAGLLLNRFELREQIGAGASRLAAKNMNGWQIDQLRELALQVDEAVRRGDNETGYVATHAFHQFLLENCGNPLLRDIWETQQLMPQRTGASTIENELISRVDEQGFPSMTDIASAIATHDESQAEEAMKIRVRKFTEVIRNGLTRGRWNA